MRTGIILDMDESSLTLLTPDGEFIRAAREKRIYSIGEEITFNPSVDKVKKRKFAIGQLTGMKRAWLAAAAVFLLMASAIFPLQSSNKVYAYMSIDVNPSIELGLNEGMKVIKLNAYNPEGKSIVTSLKHWEKESVSKVAEDILSEIRRQGYFSKTNEVIISAVNTNKAKPKAEEKLKETIEVITQKAVKEKHEVRVLNGSQKELKEAHKLGVTAGKYKAEANTKNQAAEKAEKTSAIEKEPKKTPAEALGKDPNEAVREKKDNLPPGLAKKEGHEQPSDKQNHKQKEIPKGHENKHQGQNKDKNNNNNKDNNKGKNKDNNKGENKENNRDKNNGKNKGIEKENNGRENDKRGNENKNRNQNGQKGKGQNQGNQKGKSGK
ncbi:hypothetical protein D1B31_22420 [Neobacillus notoginsengisoli]|uniref:RsgI N-terminal anti-sigma domain-containing protein n=1 Tax=Neobacillus notoginsengisoli TaxID=1578198 RepID=A0A417YFJ2_9BACI|nr:anti-sigma factor domain-containing protein [Neobacillus notoginsengisoli]RHW31433.1 hypothetical protein D1B31_22420 [Neobacillus notoginsengisoli]